MFCSEKNAVVETDMHFVPKKFQAKDPYNGYFEPLSKDRIISICNYLDPRSVCRFAATSHSLRRLADDNRAWQWRIKPPERHEQNGSKEHTDAPAKIQFLRANSPHSLWFYTNCASKFMRNFSSQSSIDGLCKVIDRPLTEGTVYRRMLADKLLENDIISLLIEDDEWKPPVIGCVATILLGLKGRSARFPNLVTMLWQLLLDTEVGDKIVPKLVVAAYFFDPKFSQHAVDFLKKSVKYIGEVAAGTTDEDLGDRQSYGGASSSSGQKVEPAEQKQRAPRLSIKLARRASVK